jgi:hypothetical protein
MSQLEGNVIAHWEEECKECNCILLSANQIRDIFEWYDDCWDAYDLRDGKGDLKEYWMCFTCGWIYKIADNGIVNFISVSKEMLKDVTKKLKYGDLLHDV